MKNITDNLADLPKWAQSEITTLVMRLKEAKKEISQLTENPKSNTVVGFNSNGFGEEIKYLKDNQMITFCLPNGDISARIKSDSLEIATSGFSIGDMYIKPQVSNVVHIHLL